MCGEHIVQDLVSVCVCVYVKFNREVIHSKLECVCLFGC